MRLKIMSGLALPLSLLMLNVAGAAFSFTIENKVDSHGTSGTLQVNAITDDPLGFAIFRISGVTFNYTNNDPGITTTASFNPTSLLVATNSGNSINLLSYSIAPSGPAINAGDNDTFTLTISGDENTPGSAFSVNSGAGSITSVPEPGALSLLAIGGLGFVATRRRRV